jgi:hypothetical protein
MYKNFGRQRSGKATKYQKEIPCFSVQRFFATMNSDSEGRFSANRRIDSDSRSGFHCHIFVCPANASRTDVNTQLPLNLGQPKHPAMMN